MNVFDTIIDGFKKVFKGQNAFAKHICLFAISGFMTIASLHIQNIAEALKEIPKTSTQVPDFTPLIAGGIILLLVNIYITGYNLLFAHNAFKDNAEEYLPDINFQPIMTFIKSIPLMLGWWGYLVLFGFIFVLFVTSGSVPLTIVGISGFIGILVLYSFVQFVIFGAYPKQFVTKGLFNILLLGRYAKLALSEYVLLGILFIAVGIIAIIPSCIAALLITIFGNLASNQALMTYTVGIIGGYCSCITQLVWHYCIVQIYREKIEPNM